MAEINLNEITDRDHIGIMFANLDENDEIYYIRAKIVMRPDTGEFVGVRRGENEYSGNKWGSLSKMEYIREAKKVQNIKAKLFPTEALLEEWLNENE